MYYCKDMKTRTRRVEELTWALGVHGVTAPLFHLAHPAVKQHAEFMRVFYRRLLPSGVLVFDIGANRGEFSAVFLSLGARVVAVEPNPDCVRHIQLTYPDVTVLGAVVGARGGISSLNVSDEIDGISSVSEEWIAVMQRENPGYVGKWTRRLAVPMVTLDAMIEHFGMPDYIKIDVEGFEQTVLAGLSAQPALLSFEFNSLFPGTTMKCLDAFAVDSRFNYALFDPQQFELSDWVDTAHIKETLAHLPFKDMSGDIYVRH
jgi:FkbM family methyltransferase